MGNCPNCRCLRETWCITDRLITFRSVHLMFDMIAAASDLVRQDEWPQPQHRPLVVRAVRRVTSQLQSCMQIVLLLLYLVARNVTFRGNSLRPLVGWWIGDMLRQRRHARKYVRAGL